MYVLLILSINNCVKVCAPQSWIVAIVASIIVTLTEIMGVQKMNSIQLKIRISALIHDFADLQIALWWGFPNSNFVFSSFWIGIFGVINAISGGYKQYYSS